jgi:hypothetical protein
MQPKVVSDEVKVLLILSVRLEHVSSSDKGAISEPLNIHPIYCSLLSLPVYSHSLVCSLLVKSHLVQETFVHINSLHNLDCVLVNHLDASDAHVRAA